MGNKSRMEARLIRLETKNGHELADLKIYLDSQVKDIHRLMNIRFDSAESLAHQASINEAQQFTAVTKATDLARPEIQGQFGAMEGTIEGISTTMVSMSSQIAKLEGRLVAAGVGVSVLNLLTVIGLHFVK
jgi:hypothetical protein